MLLIIRFLLWFVIEVCSVPIQWYVRFRAVYLIVKSHPFIKGWDLLLG